MMHCCDLQFPFFLLSISSRNWSTSWSIDESFLFHRKSLVCTKHLIQQANLFFIRRIFCVVNTERIKTTPFDPDNRNGDGKHEMESIRKKFILLLTHFLVLQKIEIETKNTTLYPTTCVYFVFSGDIIYTLAISWSTLVGLAIYIFRIMRCCCPHKIPKRIRNKKRLRKKIWLSLFLPHPS